MGLICLSLRVLGWVLFPPLIDAGRHGGGGARAEPWGVRGAGPAVPPHAESENALAQAALAVSARLVGTGQGHSEIAERLDRAGMRIRPNEWVVIGIGACLLGAVVLILPLGPLGVVLGALAGFGATAMYRRIRTERRFQAFANHLPDSLQLVVGSLRAGFSLGQAVDAMVKEAPEPIAT